MIKNKSKMISKPAKLTIAPRDFDSHSYIKFGSYLEDYRVKNSDNTMPGLYCWTRANPGWTPKAGQHIDIE